MLDLDELEAMNSWWRTGSVNGMLLKSYKRKLYFQLNKYLEKRQILIINGLRRTGKTTIFYQLINDILGNTDPRNVLYFTFDDKKADIKEVFEMYQKIILKKNFDSVKNKIYIFLDEIQKVADWENKIKLYYDLYPQIKIFVTGSASLNILSRSSESLSGRIFSFTLQLLSFSEFLELNNVKVAEVKENYPIWKRDILPLFYKYLRYGSFPELANENNEDTAKKYINDSVIDPILYRDIPEEFGIRNPDILKTLLNLIIKRPGMLIEFNSISKDFGIDQKTVSNYFGYLESSLLIRRLMNFSASLSAASRKSKKAYPITPNLTFAYGHQVSEPEMLETLIITQLNVKLFYRKEYEIDALIINDDDMTAIEVKKGSEDISQIKRFKKKFGVKVKNTFLVTLEGARGTIEDTERIPAWEFLLDMDLK